MSFSTTENTQIYQNHYGWTGETRVKVNGRDWVLTTMKRYNGTISTHCQAVESHGDGGGYSFMMFGDAGESFHLNTLPKGTRCTEKVIREAHFKALAEFDAKMEAAPAEEKKPYEIKIGQVIFTDWIQRDDEQRRAIYEIEQTKWGIKYKTVLLDGTATTTDDHIRPYSKKFGIGTYYNEGDVISQEEINDLLITAHREMQQAAAVAEVQRIEAEQAATAKKAYLSQFQQADVRKTTTIIKAHILKTWPSVQKVEVRTESYSGGDSMRVTYHAPEEIQAIEDFIDTFQRGNFNSMEDIYEYSKSDAPIIDGHILQRYKYCFCSFTKVDPLPEKPQPTTPADVPVAAPTEPGAVQIVDYSEKAIAVIGDTKPIKDTLKALGGRFNFRLTIDGQNAVGWIFSKKQEQAVRQALNL